MKAILLCCLLGLAASKSKELDSLILDNLFKNNLFPAIVKPQKWGNPDEWGPYFQGDIVFRNPNQRNGILDESYRWPNGQVYYVYDSAFGKSRFDISKSTKILIMIHSRRGY